MTSNEERMRAQWFKWWDDQQTLSAQGLVTPDGVGLATDYLESRRAYFAGHQDGFCDRIDVEKGLVSRANG